MPAPGEADYRYYNCNLQAPYMKCKQITMDSFTVNEWQPSGICTYNGYKSLNNVQTFTETDLMCMANNTMSGELTMYARNPVGYSAVVLCAIAKSNDVFTFADYYQSLGNLNGVTVTKNANNLSFDVTFDPAVEVRWVFRGF